MFVPAASPRAASILRDASLRDAPQDEVGVRFTALRAASRRPHPEERVSAALLRRRCARLEGWPRVQALPPSFETHRPFVTRRHVIAFLEEAKDRVIEAAP
jgi:hypothetical protein